MRVADEAAWAARRAGGELSRPGAADRDGAAGRRRGDPPGYGFLAENAGFARAVETAGLVWIGPPPEAIEAMGSKTEARERMRAAGVPIIPGTTEPVESADEVRRLGDELGWPVAIKASAGGGGKGFRVVREGDDVERAFETARREGEAYFADPTVYVEKYLEDPRHVEVQVLADAHGNVIHLGERDCTIQRRHQKLVEETPSPAVDAELRERIGAIAVEAARAVGYRSRGDDRGPARPGRRLLLHGDEHAHPGRAHGHRGRHRPRPRPRAGADRRRRAAVAAPGGRPADRPRDRVPDQRRGSVSPAFGRRRGGSRATASPAGPGVRVDSGVVDGSEVSPLYDPMIAKLIVHGVDREHARNRMLRALDEYEVGGHHDAARLPPRAAAPPVLRRGRDLPRHRRVGAARRAGGERCPRTTATAPRVERPAARAGDRGRARRAALRRQAARPRAAVGRARRRRRDRAASRGHGGGRDAIVSPMQGTVLSVAVAEGDSVSAGQVICIVEAMKMENEVHALRDGVVAELTVAAGEPVSTGQVICVLAPEAG